MTNVSMTKTQRRLYELLINLHDKDIQEAIIDVINIERRNRSAKNFPIREVRDVIDRIARLQENGLGQK